jgi:hypothetical protein
MAAEEVREGRGAGAALILAAGCLAISVGQPALLIAIPFGLIAVFLRSDRRWVSLLGAALLGISLAGEGLGGVGWLDRGWALLVGASFLAAMGFFPGAGFLVWGVSAVALAAGTAALVFAVFGGWSVAHGLMSERLHAGAEATVDVGRRLSSDPAVQQAFEDAARRTAEVQIVVFPALMGLASILGLGVAWWVWMRMSRTEGRIFAPFRSFRFPDPMIWVLIAGIVLLIPFGLESGVGQVGANLVLFMSGLFVVRGVAVSWVLSGGISWWGALLMGMVLVLAAPLVFAGAWMVGVGDSWWDFRARAGRGAVSGSQ